MSKSPSIAPQPPPSFFSYNVCLIQLTDNRMSDELRCYRCGESLAALTPPISRQDECPACENYLHVCRMCIYFDRDAVKQCLEDDAEEVIEKEKLNFCEWYKPSSDVFDPVRKTREDAAKSQLESLFGEGGDDSSKSGDDPTDAAEDLFK